MTTATPQARKAAVFAKATTSTLIQSALILEAKGTKTSDERLTLAWISDEIERRAGGVQDDEAFCDLLDAGMSYTEALLATFPTLI